MNKTTKPTSRIASVLEQREARKRLFQTIDRRNAEMQKKFEENRKRMKRR